MRQKIYNLRKEVRISQEIFYTLISKHEIREEDSKELFDGSKILKGLVKACEKRPISLEQLEEFVDEVERDLKNNYTEVHSEVIGQTVMDKLIALDEVSYVRFASVYKHFDDVQTFIHEIEQMEGKGDGK